jgi:hypothetical protein
MISAAGAGDLAVGGDFSLDPMYRRPQLDGTRVAPETRTHLGRFQRAAAAASRNAGQTVGVKQGADRIWRVSFMDYDLEYFDELRRCTKGIFRNRIDGCHCEGRSLACGATSAARLLQRACWPFATDTLGASRRSEIQRNQFVEASRVGNLAARRDDLLVARRLSTADQCSADLLHTLSDVACAVQLCNDGQRIFKRVRLRCWLRAASRSRRASCSAR